MKTNRLLLISGLILAVLALQAAAWADGDSEQAATAWPKKPSFSVRLGAYFSDTNGQIRVDGQNGQGATIDLQKDLNIPATANVFRARADVRIASWFGIEGQYYRIGRSKTATIDRDLAIDDEVFPINATVSSQFNQNFLDLDFKFFLLHRQRFDLGLWLGANVHFLDLSLNDQTSEQSVNRKTWYPVPALGVVFSYSILPRLYLYGKAGYFYYKDSATSTKLEAVRGDINLDYYIWKSLGVGVTYEYYKNTAERNNTHYTGLIQNRLSGIQIYGVIGF